MLESSIFRWVVIGGVAIAIVALLLYARGDENGLRRDPAHGQLGAPTLVVR